jgi:hypothetical protein
LTVLRWERSADLARTNFFGCRRYCRSRYGQIRCNAGDGPDESSQLTRDRGDHDLLQRRLDGILQWCQSLGRKPLAGDPDTIAMYLVRRADDGCTVSTLRVGLLDGLRPCLTATVRDTLEPSGRDMLGDGSTTFSHLDGHSPNWQQLER